MDFRYTKSAVLNRGSAPDSYLTESIEWARTAPDEIFAPKPAPAPPIPDPDIYAQIKPRLGPWENLLHRKAAMLEEMRVHAGFESSWNFNEGVDVTNDHSLEHKTGEETGVFQVSYDSTWLANGAMKPFAQQHGIDDVDAFIVQMKADHNLAFEYYARLVRFNTKWAGPIKRHEIDRWLSRNAVDEFRSFLSL